MSAAPPPGVGFIGLGQIGAPMATRLLAWPHGLTVCDVAPEATEPFAEGGAHVAATPAEVAERAGVISIMVRDDAQVTEVLTGPEDGRRIPGRVEGGFVNEQGQSERTLLAFPARVRVNGGLPDAAFAPPAGR